MDPLMIHKIQIINKYKKQQLLNKFLIYFFATVTCSLFCSSPFWYPPLCTTINVFLSVSLPKLASLFVSAKVLFIIGNLIVIFLVGESKFFTSDSSHANDVHYDEHVKVKDKEGGKLEKGFEEKVVKSSSSSYTVPKKSSSSSSYKEKYWGEEIKGSVEKELEGERMMLPLPAEKLSKMADDFIARVNKQRRLEAFLYSNSSSD